MAPAGPVPDSGMFSASLWENVTPTARIAWSRGETSAQVTTRPPSMIADSPQSTRTP